MEAQHSTIPVSSCLQDLPVRGAAKEIDDFLAAFGGSWPPRPSFVLPPSFHVYHQIWEDSTTMIQKLKNPEKFRHWMKNEFEMRVSIS